MKITIFTNTFNTYHRQDVAMDALQYICTRYKDNLEAFDLQFHDTISNYPFLVSRNVLKDTKKEVGGEKNLPMVSDIFKNSHKITTELNADGFIIMNSDVIILPKLIDYLLDNKPKCMAFSRTDIEDVSDFEELLIKGAKFVRTEIAGYDVFYFSREWADDYGHFFEMDYLLGKPLFDNVWAGHIKLVGDNSPLGNDLPPYAVHIHHGISSVTTECPEKTWNEETLKLNALDNISHNVMFYHLKKNLLRRTPFGSFLNVAEGEKEFEKEFFDALNIHTENKLFS